MRGLIVATGYSSTNLLLSTKACRERRRVREFEIRGGKDRNEMKTRILFLCHGNICRSPMAEFIMRHLCEEAGVAEQFEISSAAVSREEIGNDIYPPAKRVLTAHGIPFDHRAARQVTRADFEYYDYIICADRSNVRLLQYYIGISTDEKHRARISLLMEWAGKNRDVSDPWYTGDFETAYQDIFVSCQAILSKIA